MSLNIEKRMINVNHTKSRYGYYPIAIVDHIVEGKGIYNTWAWFKNPSARVSSHFVVGEDGKVIQCVRLEDMAWCNGIISGTGYNLQIIKDNPSVNPNLLTVSIEHEGLYHERHGALTPKQFNATVELHKHIIREVKRIWGYQIPLDRQHILGHYQLDPFGKPYCPGERFPFDELINALKGIDTAKEPKHKWGSYPAGKYKTTVALNVRDEPTTKATILDVLPADTVFNSAEEIRENVAGIWLKLKDREGYVCAEMLDGVYVATLAQPIYRVQVGAFSKPENAKKLDEQIQSFGYDTWITKDKKGVIRIQVGAFSHVDNARKFAGVLRAKGGFDTYIVKTS